MPQLNSDQEKQEALKARLRHRIRHIQRALEDRHEILPQPRPTQNKSQG